MISLTVPSTPQSCGVHFVACRIRIRCSAERIHVVHTHRMSNCNAALSYPVQRFYLTFYYSDVLALIIVCKQMVFRLPSKSNKNAKGQCVGFDVSKNTLDSVVFCSLFPYMRR